MYDPVNPILWLGTSSVAYSEQALTGTSNCRLFIDNSTKNGGLIYAEVHPIAGLDFLRSLYAEFEEEDIAMAEEGLSEYVDGLAAIDEE